MNKSLEQSLPRAEKRWEYWAKLILATILALGVAFIATIAWVSYQQTRDYLHPRREIASGALLRANGIEFQDVELLTEDHVRLSAWYTPLKTVP